MYILSHNFTGLSNLYIFSRYCGATGKNAHTRRYCSIYQKKMAIKEEEKLCSIELEETMKVWPHLADKLSADDDNTTLGVSLHHLIPDVILEEWL